MSTRVRYVAEYSYPGAFLAETVTRSIQQPTLETVVAAAPADTEGYFTRDGWYAVTLTAITEKRFTADDGEETWVRQSASKIHSWVIGEKVHVDDIAPTDHNRMLIANIRGNTEDGYAVRTRCGNWQLASDYDTVLAPQAVSA